MANRHLARSIALQSLFEWDFYDFAHDIDAIVGRNILEFAPGMDDNSFTKNIIDSIKEHKVEIDDIIQKAAPEWPLRQIAPIDRNVLRIGLAELLFGDRAEVPPKVAINEAIELAKTFGGDSSGKFVNGVLGTVYREIGEPGKDDTGKKRVSMSELDLEKLPREELGGAVVIRRDGKKVFFALVHDVFGHWTFSKGHLEAGEDVEAGTIREIKEELGVTNLKVVQKIGDNEYLASDPETGPTRRHVNYFLIETPDEELHLESSGGLDDAAWFSLKEVREVNMYDDIKPVLEEAIKILNIKS